MSVLVLAVLITSCSRFFAKPLGGDGHNPGNDEDRMPSIQQQWDHVDANAKTIEALF